MKKRSKLDLTASDKGKSQAAGFDADITPKAGPTSEPEREPEPEPRDTRRKAPGGRHNSRHTVAVNRKHASRALVVVTVAVAAVAVLSLFVLKRR